MTREFRVDYAEKFGHGGIVGPFTLSDVQKCVLHAMESVHFDSEQKYLPGHSNKRFMKRSPVLAAYREAGLIDSFPLHDDEALTKLYAEWSNASMFKPPIEAIRDYFGENVALYASFTSFYTMFLIPMATLGNYYKSPTLIYTKTSMLCPVLPECLMSYVFVSGVIQFLADKLVGYHYYDDVVFSLLNLIAVTIFLEFWKRRSNEHSFKWGTGGKLRHKRPRAEFRGQYGLNPVTGRSEVQYPFKKTLQKLIFVSIPITLVCLLVAFVFMLLSFKSEVWMTDLLKDSETGIVPSGMITTALSFVPSVAYAVIVVIMNIYYLHLAHYLTEWENHRTQEQFERYDCELNTRRILLGKIFPTPITFQISPILDMLW